MKPLASVTPIAVARTVLRPATATVTAETPAAAGVVAEVGESAAC